MFRAIDFPSNVLRKIPPAPDYTEKFIHRRISAQHLSLDVLKLFAEKGIDPSKLNVILFYAHPGSYTSIHADVVEPGGWTINVVVEPANIEMKWFTPHAPGEEKASDLLYVKYKEEDCTLITGTTLGSHLCRIDVPHEGKNVGVAGTWLLSLRIDSSYLSWEEAQAKFA